MIRKHTSRKLFLKIEYISLELEEVTDLASEYKKNFDKEFHKETQYLNYIQNEQKIVLSPSIDTEKHHPKFVQKIYRNIAKKYHPDVCAADNAEDVFKKATEFYETNNLVGLISVCNKEKIKIPDLTDEMVREIENSIVDTEEKIKEQQSTLAWIWYNFDGDKSELRDKIYELLKIDKEKFEEWKNQYTK